jgi:hypothetical protein
VGTTRTVRDSIGVYDTDNPIHPEGCILIILDEGTSSSFSFSCLVARKRLDADQFLPLISEGTKYHRGVGRVYDNSPADYHCQTFQEEGLDSEKKMSDI